MTQRDRVAGVLTAVTVLAASPIAHACPVCFRIDDHATVSGVYAAVFVLFGVTTGVLAGVAAFVVRFIRRERRVEGREAVGA